MSDLQARFYFYLSGRLVLVKQSETQYLSMIRAAEQMLVQLESGHATLSAAERQHTVLGTLGYGTWCPIKYTAYGYDSGVACPSLLRFTGQRKELATGHYVLGNGYRAFNPVLMRFNGPDTLSPFGVGGVNAYSYCDADPVNNSDPTGHMLKSPSNKPLIKSQASTSTAYPPRRRNTVADDYWNSRFEILVQGRKNGRLLPAEHTLERALSTSPFSSRSAVSIEAAKRTGVWSPHVVNDLHSVNVFLAGQSNSAELAARSFKAQGGAFKLAENSALQVSEEINFLRKNLPVPPAEKF